jgi:hypothetical protein
MMCNGMMWRQEPGLATATAAMTAITSTAATATTMIIFERPPLLVD